MNTLLLTLALSALTVHAATVAHYKFENADPVQPLLWLHDSSGNGHHARVLGDATES